MPICSTRRGGRLPKPPAAVAGEREGLVNRVGVPFASARAENRISGVALPAGNSVFRPGQPDLSVIAVAKSYIKHLIPGSMAYDLACRHFVPFPGPRWLGRNRVARVLRPREAVRAGRVADGVGSYCSPPEYHIDSAWNRRPRGRAGT